MTLDDLGNLGEHAPSQIRLALWIFLGAFVLHELEEWNLVAWLAANFTPEPRFSAHQSRVLLMAIASVGTSFAAPCLLFLEERRAARILVPLFVTPILANAATHLVWTASLGGYAPGVATSIMLLIPSGSYLLWQCHGLKLLPRSLVIALIAFVLLVPAGAWLRGPALSPGQLLLQHEGARLADWIWPAT